MHVTYIISLQLGLSSAKKSMQRMFLAVITLRRLESFSLVPCVVPFSFLTFNLTLAQVHEIRDFVVVRKWLDYSVQFLLSNLLFLMILLIRKANYGRTSCTLLSLSAPLFIENPVQRG